ncbi:Uncharacterised protein [Chlamydia abortus]|uniref:hypothetical protein n=1 Tax=Chlamydia abortus TaxID=83555 RepID=UPI000A27D270|nr:Uncharacterised protein [Chlamydia abortus]SGA20009.1 Uncharacterised protein [Chlamydia abortus]SGW37060.1 Uncharacterised protein [Chlamydia abortus]
MVDLGSGDKFPLGGKEGKNALQILKNTIACLVGHAPCFTFGIPGYGLSLSPEALLKLIILALLALGYAPASSQGEIPSATLDTLKKVADFFKTQWDAHGQSFIPGDDTDPYDDDVKIDGGRAGAGSRGHPEQSHANVAGPGDEDEDEDENGWCSNHYQEQLLGLCNKVSSSIAFLG